MEENKSITSLMHDENISVEEAINRLIKGGSQDNTLDTNKISDGYHAFGELYDHRITLYIALLKSKAELRDSMDIDFIYRDDIWKSKAHSDGSVWDGWFILGIFKEAGKQITYHLPMDRWEDCDFAEELDKAPIWDGHNSNDVLERLKKL